MPPWPLICLLLALFASPCTAFCVIGEDNGKVIAHIFCFILMFIILTLGDMLRDTRPRYDIIIFGLSSTLLIISAVCGALSFQVMDELSWLLVGTIGFVLLVQLFASGWWLSRSHYFLMILYTFTSPRLNLIVVFAAIFYQLTKVAAPMIYYICVLYLAVSLILVGQPSRYAKWNNPRGYRRRNINVAPEGAARIVEVLFGRAEQDYDPVAANPLAPPAAPNGDKEDDEGDTACYADVCCSAPEASSTADVEATLPHTERNIEEIATTSAPPQTSTPTGNRRRDKLKSSSLWLACLRLAAAAVAFAMFVTLCVLWSSDPLITCLDSSGSGPWEFATTQGSFPVFDNRPPLFMVERPFLAPGRMGTLYAVDILSRDALSVSSRLCDQVVEYSHIIDVSSNTEPVTLLGSLKFELCYRRFGVTIKNAYFDIDIPARYYRRVVVTQRQASPAWYGNSSYPYVGFVMGLVINTNAASYTAAWRVFAEPRVEYMTSRP